MLVSDCSIKFGLAYFSITSIFNRYVNNFLFGKTVSSINFMPKFSVYKFVLSVQFISKTKVFNFNITYHVNQYISYSYPC